MLYGDTKVNVKSAFARGPSRGTTMGALAVLLWKHFVVRKRRFIHTPIEYLSPIIYILILFLNKDKLIPIRSFDQYNEVHNTDPVPMDDLEYPSRILYTPDTSLTRDLMAAVGEKLNRRMLDYLPEKGQTGYFAFTDPAVVADYSETMGRLDAIIIFQNLNGTWPKKLEYTIRMKRDFDTQSYAAGDGSRGHHESFGRIYEPFVALQWAVDTSYLHILTGADITQNLTLQEFPYSKAKENSSVETVCLILSWLCPLSLLLVFVFLMAKLLEEKNSGIQELVRMVGVSPNTLSLSHFLNALPAGVAYAAVCSALLTASDRPFLPNSNGFIVFVALLLHFTSIIALAFAFAYLINTTQHITSIAVFVYMLLWLPMARLADALCGAGRAPALLAGLLPHAPLHWLWREVAALEQYGRGVSFSSMAYTASLKNGSVLAALLFMVLQTCVFGVLAVYFSLVRPGKYGQALPWSFPFSRQYWSKTPKVETVPPEEDQLSQPEPQYFEQAPKGLPVGIQIIGVTKAFPKNVALSNVTLDVYKGEITVLLGHNGAGKTTLMSIITGLMSPTSGRVLVGGQAARAARLGLCPQHNLFFPDLTVREHVLFFSMIKGASHREAESSADSLLRKLNIYEKKDANTDELSGGMKRRVQLACALTGGADVLILDEPTSGLDVETRRGLWDLLLSLRGERTVLLTTHFMEEADALGDRVAALHRGALRCHATTMFLKRAIGTGYRLSFTTIGPPNEPAITRTIQALVPGGALRDRALHALAYTLPAADSAAFPALFAKLEDQRSELGIDSIGVGKSTLDEVFLRLCSDVQTSFASDQAELTDPGNEMTYEKLTGIPLYARQFAVLLTRQFHYITSKIYSFLILQIIHPILFIGLVSNLFNDSGALPPSGKPLPLTLDLYRDMAQRRALYRADGPALATLRAGYDKVHFEQTRDVADGVLEIGKRDILEYNQYLVGFELNDTDAKALYTTTVKHAAPVAVNLLSNLLAAQMSSGADGRSITTYNQPIEGLYMASYTEDLVHPKSQVMLLMWAVSISFVTLSVLTSNVALPCRERASGTRHAHGMCGCPAPLYWAATLAAHLCLALLCPLLPALVAAAALDTDHTLNQPGFLAAFSVCVVLGVLACSALVYVASTALGERGAGALLFVVILLFGFLTPFMQLVSNTLEETSGVTYKLLQLASLVAPPHTMTLALGKCTRVAGLNAYCALNRGRCPKLPVFEKGFDAKKCCESTSQLVSYFGSHQAAPGKEFIVMIVQFVVYMTVLLLAERGVWARLREAALSARRAAPAQRFNDPVARAEKAYVEKAIQLPKKQISESMLCFDVYKNYPSLFKKSCYAVKGISFSVKKGECFGLLGVNGAGKSSTFRILTGESRPTRGTLFANHYHLRDRTQYMRTLSYCPQFFGLDEFLTGRRNLELVLTLRGLSAVDARQEAASWIEEVGLTPYADRRVSGYSGGCARRLAAAAALCQQAGAALLDEPTAGVDAAARRRLHQALRRAKRSRALVVASHSMDEMEVLCDRIAIMSGGEIAALGSASALRAQHAAGHAVVFKLRTDDAPDGGGDGGAGAGGAVQQFQEELHRAFDCTLKDQHQTMLQYHISDTMRYSELFGAIEALRSAFPQLLEDYSVSETTLEEVFLAFARAQGPASV